MPRPLGSSPTRFHTPRMHRQNRRDRIRPAVRRASPRQLLRRRPILTNRPPFTAYRHRRRHTLLRRSRRTVLPNQHVPLPARRPIPRALPDANGADELIQAHIAGHSDKPSLLAPSSHIMPTLGNATRLR